MEKISCAPSSTIDAIEYEKNDRILRVYFKNGSAYEYFFVPQEVIEDFKKVCIGNGESIGRWFAANIRKSFVYNKL